MNIIWKLQSIDIFGLELDQFIIGSCFMLVGWLLFLIGAKRYDAASENQLILKKYLYIVCIVGGLVLAGIPFLMMSATPPAEYVMKNYAPKGSVFVKDCESFVMIRYNNFNYIIGKRINRKLWLLPSSKN